MVVDLPVADHGGTTPGDDDRLVPTFHVDDGQTPVTEPAVADAERPLPIRAAMRDPIEHPGAGRSGHRAVGSDDSTHVGAEVVEGG